MVSSDLIRIPEFHCDSIFPQSTPERAALLNIDLKDVSMRVIPHRKITDLTAKADHTKINKHQFFLTYNNETHDEDNNILPAAHIARRSDVLKSLFEFFVKEFSNRIVDVNMHGKSIKGRINLTAEETDLTDEEAASMVIFSARANPYQKSKT